jgi:ABC-type spermidine/putrescine transport system, permease component II
LDLFSDPRLRLDRNPNDRDFITLTLAHITFTLCYVTVIVQPRLITFDHSLEEAAMDLGCPQAQAKRRKS